MIEETMTIRQLQKLYKENPNIEIETPDGWVSVKEIIDNGTAPIFKVTLDNGYEIECTEEHKIDTDKGMFRLKDLHPYANILTDKGLSKVHSIEFLGNNAVCDIEVDHINHRFYGNGISIHNSQKGLEQPVSIVAGFVNYKNRPDTDNDEVNVLYVQISRAMDKLYVINSEDYVLKSGDRVKGAMMNKMQVLLSIVKGD